MEMNFDLYIETYQDELEKNNELLLQRLKNKSSYMDTKEFISIMFADYISQDIDFILTGIDGGSNQRYSLIVMRSMFEQVIIYKYLMNNPNLISKYLGVNENQIWNESINEDALVKELKKLTQNRIKLPSVSKMCKIIDAPKNDKLSMYDIYCLLSDSMHDAYFEELGRDIVDINEDNENKVQDAKYNRMLFVLSLNYFMEAYISTINEA